MALRRVQTCDRCGNERRLGERDSVQLGGWRDLNAGSKEATFCNVCVRRLVEDALASAATREERR